MITKEQAIARLTNLAIVLKAIDSFKGQFDHFDHELEEIANEIADSDLDPEGNALDCLDTGISFYFDSFEEDKTDARGHRCGDQVFERRI